MAIISDAPVNAQPTVGHPVPATPAPRDVLADTVTAALVATGASPATITTARTTIATGQVYGSFSRAAQATGGGIAELFATADDLIQRAIDYQDTPAEEAVGEDSSALCPDGVAFCLGTPSGHTDPREHIHEGPERAMNGVYGTRIMGFHLTQWDNDQPDLAFVGMGDWPALDLDQTDELIKDMAAHLTKLRAARAQLAALLAARA